MGRLSWSGACRQACRSGFDSWNPHSERREPTSASCPLISAGVYWGTCAPHPQNKSIIKRREWEEEARPLCARQNHGRRSQPSASQKRGLWGNLPGCHLDLGIYSFQTCWVPARPLWPAVWQPGQTNPTVECEPELSLGLSNIPALWLSCVMNLMPLTLSENHRSLPKRL